MRIQNFSLFSSQLHETVFIPGLHSPKAPAWPARLSDEPRWEVLQTMGFKEVDRSTRPGTRKDSFLVDAPDGKSFVLTRAGYIRNPVGNGPHQQMAISFSSSRSEDLPTLLFYLIERYQPYFRKKIGRNPTPAEAQTLAEIENIRRTEEAALGLTPPPGLTMDQVKYLSMVCQGKHSSSGPIWTFNPGTRKVDVHGSVKLEKEISHPSFRRMSVLPSKMGIKFGHVEGDFSVYMRNLTSLEGFPSRVDGNFYMSEVGLKSLVGGPSEVGGHYVCEHNPLENLHGAPWKVGKSFVCDQFILDKGGFYRYREKNKGLKHFYFKFDWNPEGWIEVLEHGSPEAQKLMATLPFLDPDYFNSELSRDPARTINQLARFWSLLDPNVKAKIRIPPGYEDRLEMRSEFSELGLF